MAPEGIWGRAVADPMAFRSGRTRAGIARPLARRLAGSLDALGVIGVFCVLMVLPAGVTRLASSDTIEPAGLRGTVSVLQIRGPSDRQSRPVPVSIGSSDAKLGTEIGVGLSDYKGPTGIVGVLQHICAQAGIPTLSLWAQVPHYVAQPPSPKATLALLRGVEDILDVPLPLADLPEEARAWERGVDELAQQDSEVADYVRTLEEAKDAMELPEASGDAIAREFERYFRRHGGAGES